MFEKLNDVLLGEYIKSNRCVSEETKRRFRRHLELVEKDYKERLVTTRRGNNILERVTKLCEVYHFECICVIPSIHKEHYSIYKVIAKNNRDDTYTFFRFSTSTNRLYLDSESSGKSLTTICRLVGLKF